MHLAVLKAIILDRDGVVNSLVSRDGVAVSPRLFNEFEIRQDFRDFYDQIQKFQQNQHQPRPKIKLFIASNQPDIERGLMAAHELEKMTEHIKQSFQFEEILYCTHDDKSACHCRKPKSGMMRRILEEHRLEPAEAIMVGDSYKDILAGQQAGLYTVYLRHQHNQVFDCTPNRVIDRLVELLNPEVFPQL